MQISHKPKRISKQLNTLTTRWLVVLCSLLEVQTTSYLVLTNVKKSNCRFLASLLKIAAAVNVLLCTPKSWKIGHFRAFRHLCVTCIWIISQATRSLAVQFACGIRFVKKNCLILCSDMYFYWANISFIEHNILSVQT